MTCFFFSDKWNMILVSKSFGLLGYRVQPGRSVCIKKTVNVNNQFLKYVLILLSLNGLEDFGQ